MAMSEEHKAALARGRAEARAIRTYLEALRLRRPGRPVTPESLRARLERVDRQLEETTDVLRRLDLHQQRLDLQESLAAAERARDPSELEEGFIAHAKAYGERKSISYTAWREAGVPAATLKKAGIGRGS